MRPEDLRTYTNDPARHGWLVSAATVLVLTAIVWWVVQLPPVARRLGEPDRAVTPEVGQPGTVVPTSSPGAQRPGDSDVERRTVRRLDAIVASGADGFIGRPVDLKGVVHHKGNAHAFWLGEQSSRFLVVLRRDTAPPATGHAVLGSHRLLPVQTGQVVHVKGTVEAVPSKSERRPWGLTTAFDREVERIGVYINAVDVQTEGHGG